MSFHSRFPAWLALTVLAACAPGEPLAPSAALTPPPPSPRASTTILYPKSAEAAPSEVVVFTLYERTGADSAAVTDVDWSTTTGATISSSGSFTSASTGQYLVFAKRRNRDRIDTSSVSVTTKTPTATSLVVSPRSITLNAGATQQFTATGRTSTGASVAVSVTWSASSGSINPQGVFTAPSSGGTVVVRAQATTLSLRDSAIVSVNVAAPAPAPTLSALVLLPATATVAVGATQQFTVSGTWSDGGTGVPAVTYVSSGGTVSSGGLYTAGTAAGTFRVIAYHAASGRADTSEVVVPAVVQPAAPSVPSSSFTPNLPTGVSLTQRYFRPFNVTPEDGLTDYKAYELTTNATSPHTPGGVYRVLYPGNDYGPNAGHVMEGSGGNRWRRMYFALWILIPENYSVHSNGEKLIYPFRGTSNNGESASFILQIQPADGQTNGANYRLMLEPQGTDPSWNNSRRAGNTANDERISKGRYHLIEGYFVHNTPGLENGEAKWWVDGKLVGSYSNIGYSANDGSGGLWTRFRMTGYRGGDTSTTPTPPEGQYREYDSLIVYTSDQ